MGLNVFLLGHVGMECDGQQVAGPALGRLGRVALAYLITERHRPVPHAELADVLWGEDPPRSWQQLIRGTAGKLRTALGELGFDPTEVLATRFGCYQFNLPPSARVDVDTASAAVEAAVAALAMGDADQAQTEATTAAGLTSRQFVPGGFGLWIERRQAELHELHLHALEVLADAATMGRRFDRAILAAETAISLEPFRESSYHRLIAAHAAGNHRGEALQAYDRCRVALAEHLGVAPSAETEALYLGLLGTEPVSSPPSPVTDERVPLPPSLELLAGGLLVGRADEQDALYRAFRRTGSEGRQAMFVAGEPGAGKTSLVADLARRAHAAGGLVLYGRCDEDLGLAFQPFAEALGSYVSHMPQAELDAHVRRWGGELSRLTPDLIRRVPTAPAPAVTEPEEDRFRLFQAVTDLLEQATAARPVVLVLDDLHWAAPATVLLLRHLVRNLQRAPVLLVGTYRHTELPRDSPLAGALADFRRESAVERMLLEGLDDAGVQAILEATRGDEEGGDLRPIALAIHSHTGGNPFFVGELVRHLQESGAVYRKQEGWSYYADTSDAGIPHGVRDVVGRRLGRLSKAANEALLFAAVIGVEFEVSVLELTTATETRDQVLDAIDEAVVGHLAVEVGAGAYRFAHALVRDTIYDGLSSTRRARLHWRVGQALESLNRDRFTDHAALAYHFAEGAAAGGGGKAVAYAVLAADRALAGAAWEDAIALLERALTLLDLSPSVDLERRYEVLIRMADIWNRHFAPEPALVAAGAAVDAARNLGSHERLGRAAEASLAASAALRGPGQEGAVRAAIALVEEVLPALGESAPGLRATLLARLAQRRLIDGCDAEALLEQALRLARQSANPNELAIALLAGCAASRGSPQIQDHLARAEELIGAEVAEADRLAGHWQRAMGRMASGDRPGFEADFRLLEERGRRRRALAPPVAAFPVAVALMDGRFSDAENLLASPPDEEQPGFALRRELRLRQLMRLYYEVGDVARAADVAEQLVTEWGNNEMHGAARLLLRGEADGPDADRTTSERFADVEPGPMSPERRPVVHAYRAEVAVALGGVQRALRLYEEFLPWQGQLVVGGLGEAYLGAVDRFLGMLATTAGRWDGADTHFRTAEALEARISAPPLVARTLYWHGRMLALRADTTSRREAVSLLERAEITTGRLGMARLHGSVSELLAGIR